MGIVVASCSSWCVENELCARDPSFISAASRVKVKNDVYLGDVGAVLWLVHGVW